MLIKLFMKMLLGKDVTEAVEEAKQSPKTFIFKKRVMGPLMFGAAGLASMGFGIQIDADKVNIFINSWNLIANAGRQIYDLITVDIIPAAMAAWAVILTIKGQYDAKVREAKAAALTAPVKPAALETVERVTE